MREELLSGLDPAQREAVVSDASPLCILAGAGSGKTRVLTRRVAHRVLGGTADGAHVLALTFTRKAAGELRHRLQALGVRDQVVAGTFHAVAYAQLRRRWADRGERAPALLERKVRILGPMLGPRTRPGGAAVQPMDVASEIEWAKARMIPAAQYEREAEMAGRTPPLPPHTIASLYERYEAEKRRRGLVDFDDMLTLMARALHDDEEFAASQRWRFRHLFVDEFQDVNSVQFSLLRGWLGDRDDLCVVGDPNQAIYSWNGADPRLINNFERLFPGGSVVRLDDNYRSTPQILAAAGAALAGSVRLRASRADGLAPTIRSYASEIAEARGIAAQIRRHHGPARPWSHVAVLTRTNAQTLVFEEALRAAQVPYRIRGAGRFLDQPEVVEALAALDATSSRAPFAERIVDLDAMVEAGAGTDERRANLENLVRLARDYGSLDPAASLPGFKAWLTATVRGDEPDGGGDAVEVVTFHRAKGLEWPVVFVAGLERGLVPIARAESPEAEAEERRLLYVALTRARDELHCSWAERRTFGQATVARSPSPWLASIEAAVTALAGGDSRSNVRSLLDRERAKLRSARGAGPAARRSSRGQTALGANPDPAVFTALKEWRSQAARAANVPAYVIFHDTTLAAVAERRPADRDALLSIPGLGPVKAERYGEALLRVVAETGRTA
ncbi:MAG TPA: ATP-dependent DNA helicase UvrD2 [Acidimicrobiales bacterium]|nr:ATP-dependent DNA helicase UvrD2 [Acidimicrobiales bacterium]